MQILFQIDARNDWETPDFTKYAKDISFGDQTEYAKKLTQEVCDKRADIDARLDAQSRRRNERTNGQKTRSTSRRAGAQEPASYLWCEA